ncbi:MAG: hypothetical protein U0L05_05680 [Schaedlerella sp.]|nr:hypothetical protein [Schaedlerella sp.]
MSRKKECHLCGAKLINGYCRDCGFDVGRTTKIHYRLNESHSISSLNGKTFSGKYRKQTVSPSITLNEQVVQRSVCAPKRKGLSIFILVIVFIVIIFNLLNIFRYEIEPEIYLGSYEDEITEYDPYDMVTRELSETGSEYNVSLGPGEYVVGVHIPEGSYTIHLAEGSGYFSSDDYKNAIYLWQSFGEEEEYDEVLKMQDVRLYQNAVFSISESLVLNFETKNAQIESMNYIENPLTETVNIKMDDSKIAGIDFQAGVYDLSCVSEDNWITYRIPANPEWYEEGYVEYYIWLNSNEARQTYNNLVFPEGTEVYVEEGEVILIPSERISSFEYESYYDYYQYSN